MDKLISLVEGAKRQKTPNEIAFIILLAGLTIVFLLVVITTTFLQTMHITFSRMIIIAEYCSVLIFIIVCLIPTTIGGLLSAIGISGMDRLLKEKCNSNERQSS